MEFTRRQLAQKARLTEADLEEVSRCRRPHNQLGFGYQVGFVHLLNRFPKQEPLELVDELLLFTAVQLRIDANLIEHYQQRRQTISEHQQRITDYLGLRRFDDRARAELEEFVFGEAMRLEQTSLLVKRATEFLAEERILQPAETTIARAVAEQRQKAREHIFERVAAAIPPAMARRVDALLVVPEDANVSPLQEIKANPGNPAVKSMHAALRKLRLIEETGALALDLTWLNGNYQRALFHKVRKSSAYRLRELTDPLRHAALACFLLQSYRDAVDEAVIMFTRLLTRMETKASQALDEKMLKEGKSIRSSLEALALLGPLILDGEAPEVGLRARLLDAVPEDELAERVEYATGWVSGRKRNHLPLIVARYSSLRKYAPAFVDALSFEPEGGGERGPVLKAIATLRELNESNKRKVPPDAETEFLSKRWQEEVVGSGKGIERPAWECAVLIKLRDEIRNGNVAVEHSKRFGHLDDFFIPEAQWARVRDPFFARSKLPAAAEGVPAYLERRLREAYDRFLASAPSNAYARVDEKGWHLSTDPADALSDEKADQLAVLKKWLEKHMRGIRLPDLLIEVDNDLGFTRSFMPASRRKNPKLDEVCLLIAAVMAHGCNLGPHTMARLTNGVTYEKLKRVGDWQLTRDTQREALAILVNAISSLDTSLYWGEGKTSASDGQRFRLRRKVLQRTFSPRFSDFALEFYSFIADNYAPFYSTPIECTDRDAASVLDGLLYNESDLELEEHYTDTHGYTEINFAAFAMLGRRFRPRIRDIKRQHIYRVDDRDYGALASLVGRADRKIDLRPIAKQWDRLGHFYASLEGGHRTASVALRRLAGFSAKNRFYRANRDLGRLLKTEFILEYMSEPELRTRIRRGLLKVEQMHALAREVFYGHRGQVNARELWEQMNSCSCLTLIVACIIYWQAKEISRVIQQGDPAGHGVDLALLRHVSPIEWDNVLVYGEYRLDRRRIRTSPARRP